MPINVKIKQMQYTFQVYVFLSHNFISNKLALLLPTSYIKDINFIKYISNDILEIDFISLLVFLIKKKKTIIKTDPLKNTSLKFEYNQKEIKIEKEKTDLTCKIGVNVGNYIYEKIGKIICEFEKLLKK